MSRPSNFPSLFIIGAQRCATSTLYGHLARHPEIFMSKLKEPRYFSHMDSPPAYNGPGDSERVNEAAVLDKEQYLQLFKDAGPAQLCGEATTTYLGDSSALNRISGMVGKPRILIMLRNPLERAYSSYVYKRNQGLEPASTFEEALKEENQRIRDNWAPIWHYATKSKYLVPTEETLSIFGKPAVRVIKYETFVTDPSSVLNELVEFLSLTQPFTTSPNIHYNDSASMKRKNASKNPFHRFMSFMERMVLQKQMPSPKQACSIHDLSERTFQELQSEFRKDILGLEKLLDWDLSDWLSR